MYDSSAPVRRRFTEIAAMMTAQLKCIKHESATKYNITTSQ